MRYDGVRFASVVLVAAALLGAALGWALDLNPLRLAALSCGAALLLAAVVIDLRERRIPNAWTYPGTLAGLALAAAAGIETGLLAVAGMLIGGGALALLALASRGGLGVGDVKLGAAVGALLGPSGALAFVLLAGAAGGVWGIGWLLAGHGRREALPYAPALAVGACAAVAISGPLVG